MIMRRPMLEEMREMLFGGKLTIAGHNHELFDEIRNYHRHEDFRIVSFWLRFRDAQGMKHNLLR